MTPSGQAQTVDDPICIKRRKPQALKLCIEKAHIEFCVMGDQFCPCGKSVPIIDNLNVEVFAGWKTVLQLNRANLDYPVIPAIKARCFGIENYFTHCPSTRSKHHRLARETQGSGRFIKSF